MKTAHDLVMAAKARIQEISVAEADLAIQEADVLIDVREADAQLLRKVGIVSPWTRPVIGGVNPTSAGQRAGLRDLDGVGHAQRGGGRLSRAASRISKRPIKSSGVGSIIHQ